MQTTDYQTLWKSLRETGRYETPSENRPERPVRTCFWHTLVGARVVSLDVIGACAALALFNRFNHVEWARLCMKAFAFAEHLGDRVIVEGFGQRAAYQGPVVFVSNHMSTLETILYPAILGAWDRLAVVLKKDLTDIPFIRRTAAAIGCIAVTRKNVREDLATVLNVGKERLANGQSVLMFPQGTRQEVFDPKKFNSLGSKLAEHAGVPIIPLAVATDFMGIGKVWRDFGPIDPTRPIRVQCGPVIPASVGARAMHTQCVDFISQTLKGWGLPILERK